MSIDSQAMRVFRIKVGVAMASITNLNEFRESDKIVDYVFKMGREIFDNNLDQKTPDYMLRIGGKLSGAYGYIAQKSAYARAERDVYEQKCEEVEKELTLTYLAENNKYKVTEVRARVMSDVSDLRDLVIAKEAEKNQWEGIANACDKMISFLQSGIKVKENEKYQSSRVQSQ